MSEITLDCKGLPCPQPVLNCKNAVEASAPARISVVVDNEAAKENVSRFLSRAGYEVENASDGNSTWTVTGVHAAGHSSGGDGIETAGEQTAAAEPTEEKITVFITSETLGRGDDVLGAGLMKNFLMTLPELGGSLWMVILVNGGVKLAVDGSPALEQLQSLESSGVTVLVCGTCLTHFGLLEQKQVGETTNMMDVVAGLQNASKVIRV